MYVQVIEGWRYRLGARERIAETVARMAPHGGVSPLAPDAPGLLARVFATDPSDPDTGIAVWIWTDKDAADAYEAARDRDPEQRQRQRLESDLDSSQVTTRGFDGLYFGHR
jgi:hypothetical protein